MNQADKSIREALIQVKRGYLRDRPGDYGSVRLYVQRARRFAILRAGLVGVAAVLAVTLFAIADPFQGTPPSPEPRPPAGPNPPAERDRTCDVTEGRGDSGTVVVYLLRPDSLPREEDFVPAERMLDKDEASQPLRTALLELLAGPTQRERRLGCQSSFEDNGDLLKGVAIEGGLAIVNLSDFTKDLQGVSTTTSSTIFTMQLNLTVFQFPNVDSIRYELNGSCGQFFRALESICQIVHRP